MKIKKFYASNDPMKKAERQSEECYRIFSNHKSDKRLIPRILKNI